MFFNLDGEEVLQQTKMDPSHILTYQTQPNSPRLTVRRLQWTFGVLGGFGFLLNVLVICRILWIGIKDAHHSKLYILSLAISDMSHGFTYFIYNLVLQKFIETSNYHALSRWLAIMAGLSFVSSLLHVMLMTTDRLIAIKFPIYHKISITRKKIYVMIIIVWVMAIFVSSTQFWIHKLFIDWVILIGGTVGSFGLALTYIYIAKVLKEGMKAFDNSNHNERYNSRKSTNVLKITVFGFFVTLVFIACNFPFSIATIVYMNHRWDAVVMNAIMVSLASSSVGDPIFYTVVEVVNKTMEKRNKKKQRSLADFDM